MAQLVAGKACLRGKAGFADEDRERCEQLVVEHRQRKMPVLGPVHAEGGRERMPVAAALRALAGEEISPYPRHQETQCGIEHGHVHMLALARAPLLQQRGQRGPGGEQAGDHIGHGLADHGGRAFGVARGLHQAAHGLHDDVVGRQVRQRPGLTEARNTHVDQPRIHAAQGHGADAQALGHAGAEVLDHHVGRGGQGGDGLRGIGVLEVEHQALLVAVERREQAAHAFAHGADVAVVIARGRLDLDDLGPQVGQQGRGQRARQHAAEVEDAHAIERAGGWGHGGNLQAMERKCHVCPFLHQNKIFNLDAMDQLS